MSQSLGTVSVGTQTDREMANFISEEATRIGVSKAEFIRRLFEHYRESRNGELVCPYCSEELQIRL
jgi:hypothetical protein